MAGSEETGRIEVRELRELPELEEAVRLQQEIWGFADIELLPQRLFVVAGKVGGQVIGAFDGSSMVGFLLAIPGIKRGGEYYLHSHMMGVKAGYRDRGVGRMLKLKQREEAIERGIGLVEWTFDPLEIKNAFFNIQKLGAVVRRYVLNQYGTTTSHLHGSLPTDRCVAEWHLNSDRAKLAVAGTPEPVSGMVKRIAVPAAIGELRASDPRRAREIQEQVSEAFLGSFRQGLAVIGFERSQEAGTYLVGPWDSK